MTSVSLTDGAYAGLKAMAEYHDVTVSRMLENIGTGQWTLIHPEVKIKTRPYGFSKKLRCIYVSEAGLLGLRQLAAPVHLSTFLEMMGSSDQWYIIEDF